MTVAKPKLLEARALLLRHLNRVPGTGPPADLDPEEVGIVGGPAHVAAGTSYHLGRDQLQLAKRPYSVYESPRDEHGLNNSASAVDIGEFSITVKGKAHNLRSMSIWVVAQCKAGTPDTQDIREVIYSPDGQVVKRWDRLGRRTSGDSSHLWHTHLSEFRNASGARMVALFTRYLTEIGLINVITDDDLDRIAARVHGRPFTAGRTLAGSVEALVAMGQGGARDADVDALTALVGQVLAEVSEDPTVQVTLADEDRTVIAARVAERITVPTAEQVRAVVDEELDEQSRSGADTDT